MPERSCLTCKHHRPYEGRLAETFGKCKSPRKPPTIEFAETARGMPDLCGPDGIWWERKPPAFEVIEDEPQVLDFEDDQEE